MLSMDTVMLGSDYYTNMVKQLVFLSHMAASVIKSIRLYNTQSDKNA
jgi:hypothetical protein